MSLLCRICHLSFLNLHAEFLHEILRLVLVQVQVSHGTHATSSGSSLRCKINEMESTTAKALD